MSISLFQEPYEKKLISGESLEKIRQASAVKRISLHVELRAMLYLGVLLTSSGIGVLIYKHLDQLGYFAIIVGLVTGCFACFGFCFWKAGRLPGKTGNYSPVLFDYILLLGCLLLLITIGYLQTQFQVFGQRWGLASFIPMVLLFITAYYFDHKGVLSLAIINLAAWVGININRTTFYGITELNNSKTIIAAMLLAVTLILLAIIVKQRGIKPHFSTVYHQFGSHGAFIASIAGIIHFDKMYGVWLLILVITALYHGWKSARESSPYIMVITSLYLYIGISYIISVHFFSILSGGNRELYANLFYYLITGVGLAILMVMLNKKIKSNAGL